MGAGKQVSDALRTGDVGAIEKIYRESPAFQELGQAALDAVTGHGNLYKVPWTPAPHLGGRTKILAVTSRNEPKIGVSLLRDELLTRGVQLELVHVDNIFFSKNDHRLFVNGVEHEMPEAVFPVSLYVPDAHILDEFEVEGVHIVNRSHAVLAGRDKSVMAKDWQRDGVSIPETVTDLRTRLDIARAGLQLKYPAVLKKPRSAVSRGVASVENSNHAQNLARSWGMSTEGKKIALLMQKMEDLGKADVRIHLARDWKTGEYRVVGGYHRVSASDDFRANGTVEGNFMRPIYDLSGADPDLTPEMIAEAIKAAKATDLDWCSVDIGRNVKTGKSVIIEVDNFSNPLEASQPIPREQASFKHAADMLMFGDRKVWDAVAAQAN